MKPRVGVNMSGANARPTLRDLAGALGVHVTTVSRALRNDPRLPARTRTRIQVLARRMGYVPDPEIARLMGYLSRERSAKERGTLAYLSAYPDSLQMPPHSVIHQYCLGARRQAAAFGFRLEEFHVGKEGLRLAQVRRILLARGIHGVLIGPQREPRVELAMDWSPFTIVGYGYSTALPETHRVANHHYHTVRLALERLRGLGYRRIGFVMNRWHSERVNSLWTAGFLADQHEHLPPERRLPIFSDLGAVSAAAAWFKIHRPDAIVGLNIEAITTLEGSGLRVGRDYAYADLDRTPVKEFSHHAGVDQNSETIGATGVDLLVGCLLRNERGLPAHPHTVLIKGYWVDGATAPPSNSVSPINARGSVQP